MAKVKLKIKKVEQGICPYCGSSHIDYDAIEFEDEQMAYYPAVCRSCGQDFEEWYELKFSGMNVGDGCFTEASEGDVVEMTLSERIKPGRRIRCIAMNDGDTSSYPEKPHVVSEGTEGTVLFVDDAGQIHVEWDNKSTLALIPGIDAYELL